METIVFDTIVQLQKIRAERIADRGILSELYDDEVIILIDNLIEALKTNYLVQ